MVKPPITAEQVIAALGLKPHPKEGGFFAETYRADESILQSALPGRYKSSRAFGTCIYYLLTPETFSPMHRLKSDEIPQAPDRFLAQLIVVPLGRREASRLLKKLEVLLAVSFRASDGNHS